jgi:hypothetical protein
LVVISGTIISAWTLTCTFRSVDISSNKFSSASALTVHIQGCWFDISSNTFTNASTLLCTFRVLISHLTPSVVPQIYLCSFRDIHITFVHILDCVATPSVYLQGYFGISFMQLH